MLWNIRYFNIYLLYYIFISNIFYIFIIIFYYLLKLFYFCIFIYTVNVNVIYVHLKVFMCVCFEQIPTAIIIGTVLWKKTHQLVNTPFPFFQLLKYTTSDWTAHYYCHYNVVLAVPRHHFGSSFRRYWSHHSHSCGGSGSDEVSVFFKTNLLTNFYSLFITKCVIFFHSSKNGKVNIIKAKKAKVKEDPKSVGPEIPLQVTENA